MINEKDFQNLIGKKINNIYLSKPYTCSDDIKVFEYDEKIDKAIYWDKNSTENVEIAIDNKVIIQIEDTYIIIEDNLDETDWEVSTSNILEEDVLNINHYYSKNIINKKIKSIRTTEDFYPLLFFIMENDYILGLHNNYGRGCQWISEMKNNFKENNKYDCQKMYKTGTYEHYSDLKPVLDKIKNNFVEKTVDNILWHGNYSFYNPYYDETNSIEIDTPVAVQVGEHNFAVRCHDASDFTVVADYFDFTENDFESDEFWHNANNIYPDIVGQKVKDVFATRFDYEDMKYEAPEWYDYHKDDFADIIVELENGYYFVISNWDDYTIFSQTPKEKYSMGTPLNERYVRIE